MTASLARAEDQEVRGTAVGYIGVNGILYAVQVSEGVSNQPG
jgi:hypothetical protein